MPVEIREIIIKTAITTTASPVQDNREKSFEKMKRQLLEECKKMISLAVKKDRHKR